MHAIGEERLRPFPLPVGVISMRSTGTGRLHPVRHVRRFSLFGQCQGRLASGLCRSGTAVPQCDDGHNALVTRLERKRGARGDQSSSSSGTGRRNYKGRIVVVAAGAINSAALLLALRERPHPNGLANSSDVVGRHYMCHNNSAMLAISKRPNPTVFQKTIGLNDFYFPSAEWDYPMGHISMIGKQDLESLRAGAPAFPPGKALDAMAKHSLDFWMTSEDLPDSNNRVLVGKDGTITLAYTENNLEAHRRLAAKLKSMLNHIGCEERLLPTHLYLGKKIPIAGTAHQCGTVRFGHDPKTSVLDVNCKAHDLDNLYVVDASFFVSRAAQ